MRFILLLLSAFFSALGLGYVKFFALGYLDGEVYVGEGNKAWIIQIIGAVMTLGPFLIYPLAAPLASSFKKKWVMGASMGGVMGILCLGYFAGWIGTAWIYLFLVGLSYGIYASAKIASIPLQSKSGPYGIDFVNGLSSIVFIIGMLLGIPLGAYAYEHWESLNGFYLGVSFFFFSSIFSLFLNYKSERFSEFKQSAALLTNETISLSFRYTWYLLSTPIVWGIGGALSLAVTAYAEKHAMGSITACSLMSLYAAIGIIAGNIASTRFSKIRYLVASVSIVFLFVLLTALPIWVEGFIPHVSSPEKLYYPLAAYMVILGFCFGIFTNLIDAEYLKKVEEDGREGTGAALQSAMISLFTFVIGAIIGSSIIFGWLTSITQFILLAFLCLAAIVPTLVLAIQNGALDKMLVFTLSRAMRRLLKLRYQVNIKGEENLPKSEKGVLFLPNHPAEIDPVIIGSYLWEGYRPRPVVIEKFYHMPVVHKIMQLMGAFPMPDMLTGTGVYKKRRINDTLESVCDSLNAGDAVMMYPSGKLMRSSSEIIGGASGVHRILNGTKDIKVVAVRITGLWGSSFSTAVTHGQTPDLGRSFLHGFFALLKNGLFFIPKRKVDIEFKLMDLTSLRKMDGLNINKCLEGFYHAQGDEPLTQVSYSRFKHQIFEVNLQNAHETKDISSIPEEQVTQIRDAFAQAFKMDADGIQPGSRLANDLGMDSLSMAELLIWLDEEYELVDVDITDLHFFSDIILAVAGEHKEVSISEDKTPLGWDKVYHPEPSIADGGNLQACFLLKCDEMKGALAIADEMAGTLTWKQLKIAALLFGKVFKAYPEKYIAVMLPSSAIANIVVMAILLAGKVPVMINWTVGRKNLEHARDTAGFDAVITSSAFLDKLDNVAFGSLEESFVFVEDIKKEKLGKGEQLIALLESRKSAVSLMRQWNLDTVTPESECVILFTSGSESAPKGVPLSHANILTNVRDSFKIFDFNSEDGLFGFLPPFHSFGFTVTLVLPMLSGIKTYYHPNPNEGRRIAKACMQYQSTIMCGTPTFISNIFKASKEQQLDSLKYILVGAEKMPSSLADSVSKLPHACILEGYGITECSPGITMNYPDRKVAGVGYPMESVDIIIVDLETHEPLAPGERGLILVHGKSVFSAYLGGVKNPFIEIDGKPWYDTGDLGYLTESGALVLAGRLKRFIKIAGEMISLPALENTLSDQWPANDDGPVLAVHAEEKEGKRPELCIFTSIKISLDEANGVLSQSGFSNLSKIKHVVEVETLPKLGTGKIDYQSLKNMIPNS